MIKIALGCQTDDKELLNECITVFGSENIEVLKRNGILNLDEIAIIISCTELTVTTVAFIYTVLADRRKNEKSKSKSNQDKKVVLKRRVIITKDGEINLDNYGSDEVAKILESLYGVIK